MDIWLNLPVAPANVDHEAGGGLGIERTALIDSVATCENSSINAMIFKCKDMLEAIECFDAKIDIGEDLVTTFNKYIKAKLEIQGVENKVIREEQTKEVALKEIVLVLEEQETMKAMKDFFIKELMEKANDGSRLMLRNNFNDNVNINLNRF